MLLIVPFAAAMSLTELSAWPVPAYVDGIGAVHGSVALLAGDHIELADVSGAVTDNWAVGASVLVARDTDTLACTGDGVLVLPGATALDGTSCQALILTADGWATDARHGFEDGTETQELNFSWSGAPLLAWTDRVAAASVGDTVIQLEGGTSVETGTAIGGLFGWVGILGWSAPDAEELQLADGVRIPVAAAPGLVSTGDLDGDNTPELVVLHPEFVGVVEGWSGIEALVPAVGAQVAVGDVTGDGCAELVVLAEHRVSVYGADSCGQTTDADGDGFTPADGDCDDADPNVNPAAGEDCNGVDDNCDGAIDEGPGDLDIVASVADNTINEGDTVRFSVVPSACDEGLRWRWSISTSVPYDCDTGGSMQCWFGDDGLADIQVEAWDTGMVASTARAVSIGNVAPVVSMPSGCGSSSTNDMTVNVGDEFNRELDVSDPGDDTVTCSVSGGPPGLRVSDCTVQWDVTEEDLGDWWVDFIAEDEDGGRMSQEVYVHVEPATTFDCSGSSRSGCCCGSGSMASFLLLSVAWGRRRRLS